MSIKINPSSERGRPENIINYKYYQSVGETLGFIFKRADLYWKERINRFVFDVIEVEEVYGWSIASDQSLPSLAMPVLRVKKFKAFGKGILIQYGLANSAPLIYNATHARMMCRLFNISPYVLMGAVESSNEAAQSAIAELIIGES